MLRCLTSDVSSVTHIMNCNLLPGLPKFREGMTECHLTPQEYGKYQGCVNWNMFYTNCNTGPHNPFHGAVSFDNIGLAWVAIFLVIFFIYVQYTILFMFGEGYLLRRMDRCYVHHSRHSLLLQLHLLCSINYCEFCLTNF